MARAKKTPDTVIDTESGKTPDTVIDTVKMKRAEAVFLNGPTECDVNPLEVDNMTSFGWVKV